MIRKAAIRQVLIDYREVIRESSLYKRSMTFEEQINMVLVGIRRGGKSSLMFLRILELIREGISWDQIAYINFEDERLLEMDLSDMNTIIEVQSQFSNLPPYYFFDEIQNITGWEHFARRLADMKQHVWITGSNAKMLSREIESILGGRYISREIYPYDFREYLEARNHTSAAFNELSTRQQGERYKLFEDYLHFGGFPESINMKDKRSYIRNIYQKIYLGDISRRNDIRNDNGLRILIKKTAESVMSDISYSRLHNTLKGIGIDISKNSVINYLSYAMEAYLLFSISNFAAKSVEKESSPKYYFTDNGLLNLFLVNKDTALLENLIAVSLYRQFGDELFFFKGKQEVDFFIPSESTAIQVSWSLADPAARKREIEGLLSVAKSFSTSENLIITMDESELIEQDGIRIRVLPAHEFLLQ